jgi:hypothetical protein
VKIRFASAAALALALAAPGVAEAQQYLMSGSAHVATGGENGGYGVRRTRTRLRLALELRIDEVPDEGFSVAGLVDLEPRAGFGGELRWTHSLGKTFSIAAGGITYFVPGTLVGPCAGVEGRVPFGSKTFLVAGPEATVFVAGSDLPQNGVVWQALLQVGVRADLF